jgi:MYXO-CTERM domain-containing protein
LGASPLLEVTSGLVGAVFGVLIAALLIRIRRRRGPEESGAQVKK